MTTISRSATLLGLVGSALLLAAGCDSSSGGGTTSDATATADTGSATDTSSSTGSDADVTSTTDSTTPTDIDAGGSGTPDVISPLCAIPEQEECNALCNTGCSEGKACLFVSGWLCVTPGDVDTGGECDATPECKSGICAKDPDAGISTCIAPCKTDAECPEDGACNLSVAGAEPFKFCGVKPAPCSPFIAGDCEAGTSCYLSGNGTTCLKDGTKDVGEACSGQSNDCKPGTTCLNYGIVKGCARLCSTDTNADPSYKCSTMCGAGNFEQQDKDTKTGICTNDVVFPTCDPLAQDCTMAGAGCYPTNDDKWTCQSIGTKEKFESCDPGKSNQCQPGLTCQAAGKCYKVCDASINKNNPACNSPEVTCIAVSGGYGYCSEVADL